MRKQSGTAISEASALVIEAAEDYKEAAGLLGKIKAVRRLLDQARDKVLKPLLEAVNAERDRWRPIEQEVASAEIIVKQKMLAYVNAEEQKAREKEKQINSQLQKGRIKPEAALRKLESVAQAPKTQIADTGVAQIRKVRIVRIVNPDVVPKKYWALNEVLIRRDALAGVEIPGVKVLEQNTIAGIVQ